jgi:hypothetical protein
MHKDQMTLGKSLLTGSLTMYVDPESEAAHFFQKEIENSLLNTLKTSSSFPVVDTFIMPAGLTRPTTTVTFSVLRKTPEKNGAQ